MTFFIISTQYCKVKCNYVYSVNEYATNAAFHQKIQKCFSVCFHGYTVQYIVRQNYKILRS